MSFTAWIWKNCIIGHGNHWVGPIPFLRVVWHFLIAASIVTVRLFSSLPRTQFVSHCRSRMLSGIFDRFYFRTRPNNFIFTFGWLRIQIPVTTCCCCGDDLEARFRRCVYIALQVPCKLVSNTQFRQYCSHWPCTWCRTMLRVHEEEVACSKCAVDGIKRFGLFLRVWTVRRRVFRFEYTIGLGDGGREARKHGMKCWNDSDSTRASD